jgi:hypothetical protein
MKEISTLWMMVFITLVLITAATIFAINLEGKKFFKEPVIYQHYFEK